MISRTPAGGTINGIRKNTAAVATADTTINGANTRPNTCSYKTEPTTSATGLATFRIDIIAAKAKPSAPSGQDSAARDMVATIAIMPVTPPSNEIATAEVGLPSSR